MPRLRGGAGGEQRARRAHPLRRRARLVRPRCWRSGGASGGGGSAARRARPRRQPAVARRAGVRQLRDARGAARRGAARRRARLQARARPHPARRPHAANPAAACVRAAFSCRARTSHAPAAATPHATRSSAVSMALKTGIVGLPNVGKARPHAHA
jgi:hypothetical protein